MGFEGLLLSDIKSGLRSDTTGLGQSKSLLGKRSSLGNK